MYLLTCSVREFLVMTIFKLFFLFYKGCSISKAFLRFKPWMVYYVSSEYYIYLAANYSSKGHQQETFWISGEYYQTKTH